MGVSNDQAPVNVLSRFIDKALSSQAIEIVGGTQSFSFLNIKDAARATLKLCLISPTGWCSAFNVGPDSPVGIREMAELVIERVTHRIPSTHSDILVRDEDVRIGPNMSSELIATRIGWNQEVSFQDTVLDEMINYALFARGKDD